MTSYAVESDRLRALNVIDQEEEVFHELVTSDVVYP